MRYRNECSMDNKTPNDKKTNKLVILALLGAVAIITGYVEALIPVSIGIPGVKPGLCNIVILFTLILYSWKEALLVSAVRILAVGYMFGNLFSISYSMAGTLCAVFIMAVLIHTGRFGLVGISASGGAMHGIGQMIVARAVLTGLPFAAYTALLIITGIVTGSLTGLISYEVLKRVRMTAFKAP